MGASRDIVLVVVLSVTVGPTAVVFIIHISGLVPLPLWIMCPSYLYCCVRCVVAVVIVGSIVFVRVNLFRLPTSLQYKNPGPLADTSVS